MATSIEYSVFSYEAYNPTATSAGSNRINYAVSGWTREVALSSGNFGGRSENSLFGFGANVYRNSMSGEIVIAFRGTEPGFLDVRDVLADLALGAGIGVPQVVEAVKLYVDVIKAYPGDADKISFTGHSLGGGLAGIMAILFERPAEVFAPAPFEQTLFSPVTLATIKSTFEAARLGEPSNDAALDAAESRLDDFLLSGGDETWYEANRVVI